MDRVTYVEDKAKAEQSAKTYCSFEKLPFRKEDRKMIRNNRRRIKRFQQPRRVNVTLQWKKWKG